MNTVSKVSRAAMRLSGLKIQATTEALMKALMDAIEMYWVVRANPTKKARGMPTYRAKYLRLVSETARSMPALVATPLPPLKLENSG